MSAGPRTSAISCRPAASRRSARRASLSPTSMPPTNGPMSPPSRRSIACTATPPGASSVGLERDTVPIMMQLKRPAAWLVVAAAAILLMLPSLVLGVLHGHDTPQAFKWASQFAEQFRAGILYPRWLPDSFDGG